MTILSVPQHLIVIADSILGAIWAVDVETANYSILLQEPEMAPPPPTAARALSLGINRVRVLTQGPDEVYIYFDNTNAHLFCRVPLCLSTRAKTGPVEILANLTSQGLTTDDFALDPQHDIAYLACQQNQILRVPLGGGDVVSVLGGLNQTVVEGPTSVAVGRGCWCEGSIYVTTNGGLQMPVNGTYTEGWKVVAVDTTGLR